MTVGSSREARLNEAFVTLADTLISGYDVVELLHTLVEVCAGLLDTQAGGLMLADSAGRLELVASTSEEAELVEVMQLAAGVGPCVDCFNAGSPMSVGDIEKSRSRWPDFSAAALGQGFRSVHATPLRLRGEILGTMNLFSTTVGELNAADVAVAQALADVATIGILQERSIRETGIVSEQLQRALDSRILIEQAKGVVAQLGKMSMDDAFIAIRRYSRDHNLTLSFVAAGITSRTVDILGHQSAKVGVDSAEQTTPQER